MGRGASTLAHASGWYIGRLWLRCWISASRISWWCSARSVASRPVFSMAAGAVRAPCFSPASTGTPYRAGCAESRGRGLTAPRTPRSPRRRARQRLQAVPNPGPAVIVGVAREGIDPAEERPAHDPLNTVINPDFIRDHDLRAIPPCHARMLPIGLRCLGPVGHQPGLRHNRQTYGIWNRLSSSQRKMWVALYALTSSGSARTTTNSPL